MTTISFYARGDGSSANNASLNVESKSQQPTTLITFNSGPSGDIILDGNGGGVDPDTTVTINGTTYNFVVEQTGTLPLAHPKVPDPLEGKAITVISVVIDGKTVRWFFVNDGSGTFALMDQIGNGAIALDNTDTSPTTVYICFCSGTAILTPTGYRRVEDLRIGDKVINDRGEAVAVIWAGRSTTTRRDMLADPSRRPVRIAANAIAQGVPHADLYVSAQHRMVLEHWWAELLFGEPRVMVAAAHLVGTMAEWATPDEDVIYHHILLEKHDIVVANGAASESFQPSRRSYGGISADMRNTLDAALPQERLNACFHRPDAMPTLKRHEAQVLLERMGARRPDRGRPERSCAMAA